MHIQSGVAHPADAVTISVDAGGPYAVGLGTTQETAFPATNVEQRFRTHDEEPLFELRLVTLSKAGHPLPLDPAVEHALYPGAIGRPHHCGQITAGMLEYRFGVTEGAKAIDAVISAHA
jgi:hypothetical protein